MPLSKFQGARVGPRARKMGSATKVTGTDSELLVRENSNATMNSG